MRAHYPTLNTPTTWVFFKRSRRVLPRGAIQRKRSLLTNLTDNSTHVDSITWPSTVLKTCRLPSAFTTAVPKAHHSSTVAASADSEDAAVGVVIVDHGSKKKASNDMLSEFVEVYK